MKKLCFIQRLKVKDRDKPILSICCITFNHKNYINKTIEGFLLQKTNFKIEIIIHDDASTDGTSGIVREFANKDSRIIPILRKTNIKSSGVPVFPITYQKAKGNYIALCEGDDYWTDPLKLQKQVDFLEKHKDYSLCCGDFETLYDTNKWKNEIRINHISDDKIKKGFSFGLNEIKDQWITKSLTVVFRRELLRSLDFVNFNYFRDVHLIYHLLKQGRGYYFKQNFGFYRIHEGGIHSMTSKLNYLYSSYLIYKELYEKNNDDFTRYKYLKHIIMLFRYILYRQKTEKIIIDKYNLLKEILALIKTKEEYVKLIKAFSPRSVIYELVK